MKKNILVFCLVLFIGAMSFSLFRVSTALAEGSTVSNISTQLEAAAEQGAGYGAPQDPRLTAALIIRSALTIIGIILVILLIYAGFLWMTAGGNEDNVAKAKKIITNSVIGLVIILAAYSLTSLIIYFALGGKENILEQQTTNSFNPFN